MTQSEGRQSASEIIDTVLRNSISVSANIERLDGQTGVTVTFSGDEQTEIAITQWLGPDPISGPDTAIIAGAKFLLTGRLRMMARRLELDYPDALQVDGDSA